MTGIYLTGGILIAGLLFANRNVIINNVLIILFGLLQTIFTIYQCSNYRATDLEYFTSDSLGLLFLITLTVVSLPALMHSYLYIKRSPETSHIQEVFISRRLFC
jgi:hydrogenase-4 component F